MRSPEDMATELAFALPDEVLTELCEMLDEDCDGKLYEAVAAIVEQRHPELFADPVADVVPKED